MILPQGKDKLFQENWFPLNILGILPIYSISTYGRVFNHETKNYLPQNIYYDKNKYITISLKMVDGTSKFFQIHRLMLLYFHNTWNAYELDVNHKDGVKYHNWLWNLEWVTKSENVQHAIQNNLIGLGESRGNSILSNEQVHTICRLISEGKSNSEIIKIMNIDNCNLNKIITNIKCGLSWKHIAVQYDFTNMNKRKSRNKDID